MQRAGRLVIYPTHRRSGAPSHVGNGLRDEAEHWWRVAAAAYGGCVKGGCVRVCSDFMAFLLWDFGETCAGGRTSPHTAATTSRSSRPPGSRSGWP